MQLPSSHKKVVSVTSDHSALNQHNPNNRNHRLSWPQISPQNDDGKLNANKESKSSLSSSKENDSKWIPSSKCLCPDDAEVMNRANQIVMYVQPIYLVVVVVVVMNNSLDKYDNLFYPYWPKGHAPACIKGPLGNVVMD